MLIDTPHARQFFINGVWRDPDGAREAITVYNPNTGEPLISVLTANTRDADAAIAAAHTAFDSWSRITPAEHTDLLDTIGAEMDKGRADLIDTACTEMGCPCGLTERTHVELGVASWAGTARIVRNFPWESEIAGNPVWREPLGVIGVLTPWNSPVTSLAKKLAAVIGAGCTAVSKPSEHTPFTALIIAEAIEAAGTPAGVVNMIQGTGPVGDGHIGAHPQIDGITLTGSVGAGAAISKAGVDNLKRMCLELGGKSANILIDDEGFAEAVKTGTIATILNTGQICFAPTPMLVPEHRLAEAETIAAAVANDIKVGPADGEGVIVGPLISHEQHERVTGYIRLGIAEGARLIAGGPDRPEGPDRGYFVRSTVVSGVSNDMRIAREEIFGPVLSILTYRDLDEAIAIANDSPFGLAAHISSRDKAQVARIARALRAGSIFVNGAMMSFDAPFGGDKMSGQGREHGDIGLEEFLEVKSIIGM